MALPKHLVGGVVGKHLQASLKTRVQGSTLLPELADGRHWIGGYMVAGLDPGASTNRLFVHSRSSSKASKAALGAGALGAEASSAASAATSISMPSEGWRAQRRHGHHAVIQTGDVELAERR